MQKGQAPLLIIVGILVAILIAGGAFYLGRQTTPKPSPAPAVVSQTPQPTPSPSPSDASGVPNGTAETANWKTYLSQSGKYSIQYPENIKIYVNEKLSVDGVKVPLKDTTVLLSDVLPHIKTNYQLSIKHQSFNTGTLKDFVNQNSSCVEIEYSKGIVFTLGNKQALIFENTPCGPFGMTVIYGLNNGLGYIIEIETQGNYEDVKKYTDQILSTFKFL